jgi:hypothetical protein
MAITPSGTAYYIEAVERDFATRGREGHGTARLDWIAPGHLRFTFCRRMKRLLQSWLRPERVVN